MPAPGTPTRRAARAQRGLSLLELLIAAALASVLLGTLLGVLRNGLQAQAATRETNEMAYQARFALGLIVARAQASAPKVLAPVAANSSGDWFAPTMYCLKGATRQLIETTPSDTGCTGTRVIADNVGAFSVQRPASTGAVDRPAATITLRVDSAGGASSLTLAASVRLGGGTL